MLQSVSKPRTQIINTSIHQQSKQLNEKRNLTFFLSTQAAIKVSSFARIERTRNVNQKLRLEKKSWRQLTVARKFFWRSWRIFSLDCAREKNFEFRLEALVAICFHFIGSDREILSCRNLLGRHRNYAFGEHNGVITTKNLSCLCHLPIRKNQAQIISLN